jgi:hypothetical protein
VSAAKHTPGPWAFSAYTNDVCNFEVFASGSSGEIVAGEYGVTEEADARLIAATPELLEALRNMVDWLDDGNRQLSDAAAADVAKARAAIAKATGGQS